MPTAGVLYRFRIYSTDDTTVETTFQAELEAWDSVGGQEVRPLEGRTEGRPWSVKVVDYSTAVTNDLADSSGRTRRIGRLADFQQNLDSSGWATLATGRISDVFLSERVASYEFVLQDEHRQARQAQIFTSTSHSPTCYVYPPGLINRWMGLNPRQIGNAKLFKRTGNLSLVLFDSTAPVALTAMQELEHDLRRVVNSYTSLTTAGNFKFLRFHANGADYEVFGFLGDLQGTFDLLANTRLPPEQQVPMTVWVVDPSTALGSDTYHPLGTATTVGVLSNAYLYSPGAPPSEGQPWHLGGGDGRHPFGHLQDVYDSSYGGRAIRYDSTALATMQANSLLPLVGYRITQSRSMGEFTEDAIYGTFGAVGFVGRDGRIMPRSVLMPSTNEIDQTALLELIGATLRPPHPTFEHTERELVTVLQVPQFFPRTIADREVLQRGYNVPADLVEFTAGDPGRAKRRGSLPYASPVYEHDRLGAGRVTYRLPSEVVTHDWQWTVQLAQEYFNRYGDGPIYGTLNCLSSGTSSILPGDFVKVTLATYPNMGIQGRGNTRIVQVLSVADTPYGPVVDYLDAGPNSTVLPAPTITLSSSTGDPKHVVYAAVGSIPSGCSFEMQLAQGSILPSTASSAWESVLNTGSLFTTSTGAYRMDRRKSGTTYWGRARNIQPGRWRSGWGYSTRGVETESLTAPSGLTATGQTAATVDFAWTNSTASTGYDLAFLDVAISFSSSGGTVIEGRAIVDQLPAGTQRYHWDGRSVQNPTGFVANTTYGAAVAHIDPFGGMSALSTCQFMTSSGIPTGDTITTIGLRYGRNTTQEVY